MAFNGNLFTEVIDKEKWEKYSSKFQDFSYRHLWEFSQQLADQSGSKVEHLAFDQNDVVVALADVRLKLIPFLGTGIAYVSGGPLVGKEGSGISEKTEKTLAHVLDELISEYVTKRKLTLRIAPSLIPDIHWNDRIKNIFLNKGFHLKNKHSGYRTIVVDISPPLEKVRQKLASKWRNCLNKSLKQKVNIRSGKDPNIFVCFVKLFNEMIKRKKFSLNLHPEFYAQVQKKLDSQETFSVSIAELDGKPVAGHVASMLGDTSVYLLGASVEDGLRANAPYLLQWHAIEMAKEWGCVNYDLGGIDPEQNPGVYRFKKRMGGGEITVPGPFEMQPSGLRGRLVNVAEFIYRQLKKKLIFFD